MGKNKKSSHSELNTKEKNIFEYDDYRKFLTDYYSFAKKENKKFSFRFFSRIAGFKSSNFLFLVMNGKSNISAESAARLAQAMKLNKEQSEFFRNLVMFNQATKSSEREHYSQQIMNSRSYRKSHPLTEYQYRYFSVWYFSVVRGLVGLPDFKEDYEWIGRQISPAITPQQSKDAIEQLIELGLIARVDGKLVQTKSNITSANSIVSSFLAHFHREIMKMSVESIDRFPRDKRDLSAMTIAVSAETFEKIKERAEEFRKEVVKIVGQDTHPDRLYQVNLYLFPVAEIKGDK